MLKVPVSQLTRSCAFYREALGFIEEFAAEEYGWAQLRAGELTLALYKPGMGGGSGHVGGSVDFHLSLPAEAFDRLAVELLKRDGVVAGNQIARGDDGTVFLEVRDPDANVLHIGRQKK